MFNCLETTQPKHLVKVILFAVLKNQIQGFRFHMRGKLLQKFALTRLRQFEFH